MKTRAKPRNKNTSPASPKKKQQQKKNHCAVKKIKFVE